MISVSILIDKMRLAVTLLLLLRPFAPPTFALALTELSEPAEAAAAAAQLTFN